MTSPKNAVSLLTAAALVVARRLSISTSAILPSAHALSSAASLVSLPLWIHSMACSALYADDGGDKGKDEDGSLAIPDSAEQAIEWIQSGKLTKEAALDKHYNATDLAV